MVDSSTFRSVRASSGRKSFLMKLELSETLNCLPFLSYQSCHSYMHTCHLPSSVLEKNMFQHVHQQYVSSTSEVKILCGSVAKKQTWIRRNFKRCKAYQQAKPIRTEVQQRWSADKQFISCEDKLWKSVCIVQNIYMCFCRQELGTQSQYYGFSVYNGSRGLWWARSRWRRSLATGRKRLDHDWCKSSLWSSSNFSSGATGRWSAEGNTMCTWADQTCSAKHWTGFLVIKKKKKKKTTGHSYFDERGVQVARSKMTHNALHLSGHWPCSCRTNKGKYLIPFPTIRQENENLRMGENHIDLGAKTGNQCWRTKKFAGSPPFWRKDHQSLPTFVSFVYVSMGGMSGKHSAEL